jgi:DNA replication and repair protein RecF
MKGHKSLAGIAVKSLALSHFRSHQTAKLMFDGRPVVITGANGAGKTNILEAISLLSPGRGLRRAAADDMARKPENLGWKITADVQGLGAAHQIETWAKHGEGRQVLIDGKTATQVSLARILRMVWLVPVMDRLWVEAAEGRRRFLDRMTLSFAPDHADAVLTYEKAMRDRNRLLKDQITDAHWYSALEDQMAQSGLAIMTNRATALSRLLQAQIGAETAFPRADLALIGPDGEDDIAASDLGQALSDNRRRDIAAGRTLVGPHRADLAAAYTAKSMPADQCSTGEQKALLISLILANARALAADLGTAPILLLDEVAAHLDAARRAALYDELCILGAQAVMTGTGQELFDTLGKRGQAFEVAEIDGRSHILQVAP